MSISVISAIYGPYDTVKPVMEQTVPVDDWIMVTDDIDVSYDAAHKGWEVVFEPRPHMHPCMAAKIPKFNPELYVESDYALWVDASFTYEPTMAQMAMDALEWGEIALFPHPHRTTIEAEAELSLTLPKYAHLPLREQVKHYKNDGFEDTKLWATGVMAYSLGAHMRSEIGNAWLAECARWSYQDEISFPYVMRKYWQAPVPIGESQFTSPHVHLGGHI